MVCSVGVQVFAPKVRPHTRIAVNWAERQRTATQTATLRIL